MKKQKISEFIKNKSFYLVLLTGLAAILVIAIVYVNIRSTDSGNNLVDLNEPVPNVASEDNTNKVASNENSKQQNSSAGNNNSKTSNGQGDTNDSSTDLSLLENDIVSDPAKENSETKAASTDNSKSTNSVKKEDTKKDDSKDTKEDALEAMSSQVSKLSFNEEDGLTWPVNGDVLLNYSMDHGVYFATLGQYKCNPAILIGAKVGTEVKSAAKGIVTAIEKNDETGLTITMDIGSDYTLVYGQLKDAKVEVGDSVKEGDILGSVAEPTKYYVVEGSNLFFEVINDKEPINPMLLLK